MTDLTAHFIKRKRMKPGFQSPVRLWNFTRVDLARFFAELGYMSGAEIGVQRGKYSEVLCREIPNLTSLLVIDPYFDYGEDEIVIPAERAERHRREAQQRLAPFYPRVTHQWVKSLHAVKSVEPESLSFVYIDGNHTFDHIMRDLIEWVPKVKPGGIVAGHDFYQWDKGGVVTAVNAYVEAHGITEWFLTDDDYPSWFWMKA